MFMQSIPAISLIVQYRRINQVEGFRGYFKGLGPNLIGVIPARSINFFTYGNGKAWFTKMNNGKETTGVHLISAATAGNLLNDRFTCTSDSDVYIRYRHFNSYESYLGY